jgi:hypothetical protein
MYCIRPVIHERPGWISRSTLSGRSGTCFGRNRDRTRGTPPQLTAQVLLVASPGPVELFPLFTAAQGASSLRVRAGQTPADTFRAHEHERAADMPSLPQAVCRSMRGRRDGEEAAPELAYSDDSRTHTRGVRTLEPRKPCLAEAVQTLWQRNGCAEVSWARIADCALPLPSHPGYDSRSLERTRSRPVPSQLHMPYHTGY